MPNRLENYDQRLVHELAKLPKETEWVEFKCNNADPQMIAEYVSALSNSAALRGKPKGYLVWGVEDATHEIVGTDSSSARPRRATRSWSRGSPGWSTRSSTCASASP